MSAFQEKPILQGVLWKRAQKSGSNWKKRYFKLFANRLEYSVKENGKERGRMNFTEEFFVQDGIAPKGKFGFLVTDFVTSHHLATDTKDQKDFWCHAIATVIRKQLELAKYFEEVRKSVKIADVDLAEKQYQARLDNYYKTVGRPANKQNRKSVVDLRAAQILAEATEAAEKLEQANEAAEKERLREEAERLAKEAQILREVAEKDEQPESLTVGAAPIPEGDEEAAESEDEEELEIPPLPPMPPAADEAEEDTSAELTVALPPAAEVSPVEPSRSPKGPPPQLPPRKNTIQPTQAAEILTAASSESAAPSRRPTIQAKDSPDALLSAAAPSWSQEPETNNVASSTPSRSGSFVGSAPASTAPSRSGSMIGSAPSQTTSPTESRKPSVSTTTMAPRPSVVALAKTFESSPSTSAAPSRKNTVVAEASPLTPSAAAAADPTPPAARKLTVTSPPPEAAPARKLTVTTLPSPTASKSQTSPIAQVTQPPPSSSPSPSSAQAKASPVASSPPPAPEPAKATAAAATPAKVGGGIASKLGIWQNKVDNHMEKQSNNVFSGAYQGGKVAINKDQYGKAPEGSVSS